MGIEQLTGADFTPHLHQFFYIRLDNAEPVALELVSTSDATPPDSAQQRRPFSLLFLGPVSQQYLRQHTYTLEHEHMGALVLFLVPLGPQNGRMRYEAIFN